MESAPPMEVMLKEREIASEALFNDDADHKQDNETPSRTTDGQKVVYIYQSHSWESYLPLLKNANSPDEAVSSNNLVNVVGIGEKLREELESKGIGAKHSTINANQKLLEKVWNYNNSYQLSRTIVKEAMASNKNIQFALELHRDSLRRDKIHG